MVTELKPTNLIAVEVPFDSKDAFSGINENIWDSNISLAKAEYKLLGEVTKNKIGFDVEPYVEKVAEMGKKGTNIYGCLYMNYLHQKPIPVTFTKGTKEESFLSLLAANGLYFENPEGESYPYRFAESDGTLQTLDWHRNKWKEFEEKIIKGKLLILEKC